MSTERTLDILDLFSLETKELTVPQMAEKLKQPVSSVYRHLRILKEKGYILETIGGYYKLGYRFLEMANIVRSDLTISEIAVPIMKRVTRESGETSILTVVSGLHAVCLETIPSLHPIKVSSEQGKIMPLYGGASATSLLAFQDEGVVKQLFEQQLLKKHTPNTLSEKDALNKRLEEIRRDGYSWSDGEIDEGVFAIGMPILNCSGTVVAALSIAGPKERILQKDRNFYTGILKDAVHEMKRYL